MPGEVLHFSEDPSITRFVPHVAATAQQPEPYVWAVDRDQAPSYWFPRQCPRALAWVLPTTTVSDRDRIIGAGCGSRVHAIEYSWLPAMRSISLYAYRLPADRFRPFGTHAWVSSETVVPLAPPSPVGDLIDVHAAAGVQLRLLPDLWPFWAEVTTSTLAFSGIRLHNAQQPGSRH